MSTELDKQKIYNEFIMKFLQMQEQSDPEIQEAVSTNFWEWFAEEKENG